MPENPTDAPDADKLRAEAELEKARAEKIAAETAFARTKQPLVDRLILRGLIPVALAIVGPWAAYTYSTEATAARNDAAASKAGVAELQVLLEKQKSEAEAARVRFQAVEDQKAVELVAMSAMVNRLDSTLKLALIQMAVTRMVGDPGSRREVSRDEVVERVEAQMIPSGMQPKEVRRLAGEAFDRYSKDK